MACYPTQGLPAEISNYVLTLRLINTAIPDNCNLSLAFRFTHTGCTIPIIVGQRRLSIVIRPRVFSERDKSKTLNADVHLYAEAVGDSTWQTPVVPIKQRRKRSLYLRS